jgi:putative hydrolase
VDPVEALERITYLLDRDLAPGVKASAFLRAAETIRATDPDELRTLHAEGRLKELPGIGDSTGTAIAEALDGKTPGYLRRLEETTAIPIGEGGEIRALPSRAIATPTRSGLTAAHPSSAWHAPRRISATTTSS